jgi:CarD family transcriptional regulator
MNFTEGQTIVHPHHGPAVVRSITRRRVKAVDTDYLMLEIRDSNLTVSVPVDSIDTVGLRAILDAEQLKRLLDVLAAPTGDEEQQWSRRLKANQERLRSGDTYAAAAVVRDLSRRLNRKGLSLAEKDMLKYAKRPLVIEVALAVGVPSDEADAVIDSVVSSAVSPAEVVAAGTSARDLVAAA